MSQPQTPCAANATHMRGGGASQHAPRNADEAATTQAGETHDKRKENPAEWRSIKEDLTSIKEGLKKEKDLNPRFIQDLSRVIARVTYALREGPLHEVEARLGRIESILRTPTGPPRAGPPGPVTWASVAAGIRQAGAPETPQPTRHTVRVQMAQAKDMANEEILREVKKTISGAAAIRILKSGDIDVTVPDEASKDRAHGLPSTTDLIILRKDYLVEVPGVPLSMQVAGGKDADNTGLAESICTGSRGLTPGLQITRIRWLHDQKEQERRRAAGKTRGSLVIGFPTQDMQRRAIQGGLVMGAQLYEVRPFERSLQIQQCFRCNQWGHTQGICAKKAKCGQCAGDHDTDKCPKERVSCVNCGKAHRAWQRRECKTFQAYYTGIQNRRIALYTQATRMRSAAPQRAPAIQDFPSMGWTTVGRKRTRGASPAPEDTQRRQGRPSHIEQAARASGQSRLAFGIGEPVEISSSAPAAQAMSTPSAEIDLTMTQNEW